MRHGLHRIGLRTRQVRDKLTMLDKLVT